MKSLEIQSEKKVNDKCYLLQIVQRILDPNLLAGS